MRKAATRVFFLSGALLSPQWSPRALSQADSSEQRDAKACKERAADKTAQDTAQHTAQEKREGSAPPRHHLSDYAKEVAREVAADCSRKLKTALPGASLQQEVDYNVPLKIGYGFIVGFSSGFCLKRVSKVAAFVIGASFVSLQGLAYNGYIQVNHEKIKREIEDVLDVNNDGECDAGDIDFVFNKVSQVLSHNLPSGGGFALGLALGLRS